MVGSGSNVYGGVDWVSVGLSAPEHVDLRNPKVRVGSRCQLGRSCAHASVNEDGRMCILVTDREGWIARVPGLGLDPELICELRAR